jgi:hypothetical protein
MTRYRSHQTKLRRKSRVSGILWFLTGTFWFLVLALLVSIPALYFTKKDFAAEVRQVRQPKPNHFFIGIDVSQTIEPDVLSDFINTLISRLHNFIGQEEVFYDISIFGLPGCGEDAIATILTTQSPKDAVSFGWTVEKKIRNISIAARVGGEQDTTPLTTPLFYFLKKILTERVGERVIIFSDLVNDDRGCQEHSFPLKRIEKFGLNKGGQIIFLYPTPHVTRGYHTPDLPERLIKNQKRFIMSMYKLSKQVKVRAFFYHIPDNPQKREAFFKSQLQHAIPATRFEMVWERVSKIIDTIIAAVRG